jgi:cytochrome P450
MTTSAPRDPDLLRDLREPSAAAGGVFWRGNHQLMVFDPDAAAAAHADNFADLTMPDRLVDLLRRRSSTPVSWKAIRTAWLSQLRQLSGESGLAALDSRMAEVLHARAGQHVDLPWLAHEVSFRSLLPVVIDGLPARDEALIVEDALVKLDRLMRPPSDDAPLWRSPRRLSIALRAGLVIRRELRRRARRRVLPRLDLTEPIATELLDSLGMDRALHSVAAALTAIAGPPGATAANVMYALVAYPQWAQRLTAEFAGLSAEELYRTGTRCAPVAHRFVKEVLRMWTSPTMLTRSARTPIRVAGHALDVGQHYILSPTMAHHDPRHWPDPEVFDPDRWLPGAATGPTGGQHYVPFGWAPTACVGAGLGTMALVLLCRLFCTTFRIEAGNPGSLRVVVAAIALPLDFDGRVLLRERANADPPASVDRGAPDPAVGRLFDPYVNHGLG